MKTRLELECICKTCNTKFIIYNFEECIGKEAGEGCAISQFVCPNCGRRTLDFDVCRRDVK